MKKFCLKFFIIFSITFLIFIIFNILISYSWRYYNDYKYNSRNPFNLEVRSAYTLNEKEQAILHKEIHNLKYEYIPYLGAVPKKYKSKYVNFDDNYGRKINNNDCTKKVFFFGGSTTFGWLNEDYNTIPSLFKKISDKNFDNYCVFNYGSPWFYSKQENIYLLNLIEKKNKPDFAFFIDGINETCHGYNYSKNFKESFSEINAEHRTLIFNKKLITLIKSLPAYQLADRLSGNIVNFKFDPDSNCNPNEKIEDLFDLRIKFRVDLCNSYKISCFTFLQPFGGVHGNTYPVTKDFKVKMNAQYNALKKSLKKSEFSEFDGNNKKNNIFDISSVLKKYKKTIHYIDNVHYSSHGNELIAVEIYKIFNENR
jgi:hypothetical protein